MSNLQQGVGGFFRRVGQYLRRGSEVAGSWLDEQASITQRVRAIRHLRGEQQALLATIGGKVYALHRRGKVRNRDVLVECERIDEILAHIGRLRNEIEEIRRQSTRPEIQLMDVSDEQLLTGPEEEMEPEEEVEAAEPTPEEAAAEPEVEAAEPEVAVVSVEEEPEVAEEGPEEELVDLDVEVEPTDEAESGPRWARPEEPKSEEEPPASPQ